MSDTERIAKLAEWMGWLCRQNPYGANGEVWLFLEDPKGKAQYRLAPVYKLKDWNPIEHIEHAMMLEEEVERKGLQAAYASHLDNIVLNGAMISHRNIFKLIHATAAQRCAAVEKLMERKYVEIS